MYAHINILLIKFKLSVKLVVEIDMYPMSDYSLVRRNSKNVRESKFRNQNIHLRLYRHTTKCSGGYILTFPM